MVSDNTKAQISKFKTYKKNATPAVKTNKEMRDMLVDIKNLVRPHMDPRLAEIEQRKRLRLLNFTVKNKEYDSYADLMVERKKLKEEAAKARALAREMGHKVSRYDFEHFSTVEKLQASKNLEKKNTKANLTHLFGHAAASKEMTRRFGSKSSKMKNYKMKY